MKTMRKLVSLLVVVCLIFSMASTAFAGNFTKVEEWSDQLFTDVGSDSWYYTEVQNAYELGLMAGHADGTFDPTGEITLAQAVTIAARIHSIHYTGGESFVQGTPWYQVYVDYALANGILDSEPENWNKVATRLEFAHILAKALPAEELPVINTVEDGAIPDVEDDKDVYALYRAGILIGSDVAGTFNPESAIKRCEVATIAVRMADATLRERITLTKEEYVPIITPVQPEVGDVETEGGVDEQIPEEESVVETEGVLDENNALTVPFDQAYPEEFASGEYQYSGEHILIKLSNAPSDAQMDSLNQAGISELNFVMNTIDAKWYKAYVSTAVEEAMDAVRMLSFVLVAEYDYVYETDSIIECDVGDLDDVIKGNQQYEDQWYLRACGIRDSWDHLKKPHTRPHYDEENGECGLENGEEVSGTEAGDGIIVAVIDTGVDYTHEDLKANMWINVNEIPDNGCDDDGNGYVDDYYGYDAVAGQGSGMDDNGHGTHVAGIIAASNNNIGVVGIAYNAKIMTIKAGMSSGYFNQSDIAEAIIYACANGADVINMSFGGSASTILVQDALADAYTHCILVAAAGNDGLPNEGVYSLPTYPAALTYVLGVMSVDSNGVESSFTNWDVSPHNSVEYELYAPGDQMVSTIPGNRYATWSGTSMAAPVVSAMAALLRSEFRDRSIYPTKFIYGQLASTSSVIATCFDTEEHGPHNLPQIVDLYSALTKIPNPEISVSDYALFDTEGLMGNETNNGDGVVDAGETFALGFMLRNRWGKSSNTTITVDTLTQAGLTDPYITIHNKSVNIGSIGTYSTYDGGRIVEDDQFVGWENPIYITVSSDCPNDYLFKLNVTITCENGLNANDETEYTSTYTVLLNVRRGVILPSVIDEDMTLTADNYYIIPNSTLIQSGVTVTVEAGTNIQFWSDDANDPYADQYMAYLKVDGTLICNGTAENPINMFPGERMDQYRVEIQNNGRVELYYTDIVNPYIYVSYAEGCRFSQNYLAKNLCYRYLSSGSVYEADWEGPRIYAERVVDCFYYKLGSYYDSTRVSGSHYGCVFVDCAVNLSEGSFENCLFYGNNNYLNNTNGYKSNLTYGRYNPSALSGELYTDPVSGSSYYFAPTSGRAFELMAEALGGSLLCINTSEELSFIQQTMQNNGMSNQSFAIGLEYNQATGEVCWADGTKVADFIEYTVGTEHWTQSWIRYNNRWGNTYVTGFEIGVASTGAHSRAIYEFPARYVETITLDSYEVVLDSDSAGRQIYADAGPSSIADATLVYVSMDESVAEVSETGFITPAGVGETEIWVYAPDMAVYNYVTVHVVERVDLESIALVDDFRIDLGAQVQLNPVLMPANTTQTYLVYSSSDETVAMVSGTGVVTGVGSGTAVITVTNPDSDISASVTVEGVIPVESITVEEPLYATHLSTVETVDVFEIVIEPVNATYQDLIWESSNPEVLTVDESGNLVKSSHGTATLRATVVGTGLYTEITVAITAQETEVTVKEMQYADYGGDYYTFALLDDGSLWYWGNNTPVPEKLPIEENVAHFAVSAWWGEYYILVLDDTGTLNVYTVSDYDSNLSRLILNNDCINGNPVKNVVDVAASNENFAYVLSDGTVWGWGANNYGQLGTGGTDYVQTAQQVAIDATIVEIAFKYSVLAALDEDGNIWCCGHDNEEYYYEGFKTDRTGAVGLTQLYYNFLIEYDSAVEYNFSGTKYNNPGTMMIVRASSHWYVGEDGYVYVRGSNSCGYLGIGDTSDHWDGYIRMEKVSNVSDIFVTSNNAYIQTEDGKFYGVGYNNNNQIPNLTSGNQYIPSRIFFGLSSETDAPALEDSGLEDGVLNESQLVLDFDQAIASSSSYGSIRLKDSDGLLVGVRRTVGLDKFTIVPTAGFTAGETYTLSIPAGAFVNRFGVANAAISLTFTVSELAMDSDDSDTGDNEDSSDTDSSGGSTSSTTKEPVIHDTQANPEFDGERIYLSLQEMQAELEAQNVNSHFLNNAIINRMEFLDTYDVTKWLRIQGGESYNYVEYPLGQNYWGTTNETLIGYQILDFNDFQTLADLDHSNYLTTAPETVWPFAVDAGLINESGEEVSVVGFETVTVFVEFNRDMETSIPLDVRFGSCYPYGDYQVEGKWVSERRWEGTIKINTLYEAGYHYFSIENGHADGNSNLQLFDDWGRFMFEIDTTEALAMTLQGQAGEEGITLAWTQDDFDTLMGYNVYRADQDEDGYYQKLNTNVIPFGTETYFDDTVEPGKVYYYTFTVVKTDFSESEPSGKIRILSKDTMSPVLYHTPVYTAYEGNNVVVSATASDNLQLVAVKLFYRVVGTTSWTEVTMSKLNDKYSAIISGDKVAQNGIEYYITATDGVNTVTRGTASNPYTIVVKADPGDQMLGDVDGDGTISLLDALMHLQAVNGRLILTDEQFARADLNGDNRLTASEALRILQYVNGKIGSLTD